MKLLWPYIPCTCGYYFTCFLALPFLQMSQAVSEFQVYLWYLLPLSLLFIYKANQQLVENNIFIHFCNKRQIDYSHFSLGWQAHWPRCSEVLRCINTCEDLGRKTNFLSLWETVHPCFRIVIHATPSLWDILNWRVKINVSSYKIQCGRHEGFPLAAISNANKKLDEKTLTLLAFACTVFTLNYGVRQVNW